MSKHWGQINHVIGARVLLTWGLGGGQSALGSGVFSKPGKEARIPDNSKSWPRPASLVGSYSSSGRKFTSFFQRRTLGGS